MVYSISWNEGTPIGATTPAADIDVEIQNVKVALRERLEQVIPDFDTDGVDPKKIVIVIGDAASLPGAPDYDGELYFATDTLILYIGSSGTWLSVGGSGGGGGVIPTAPGCTMVLTSDYLVPSSAYTAIPAWTILYNSGGLWSPGAPERVTIPESGTYFVSVDLCLRLGSGSGAITCYLRTYKNGSFFQQAGEGRATGEEDRYDYLSCVSAAPFAAGDYLDFRVTNNTGAISGPTIQATYSRVMVNKVL